jgi:hypothetical protein
VFENEAGNRILNKMNNSHQNHANKNNRQYSSESRHRDGGDGNNDDSGSAGLSNDEAPEFNATQRPLRHKNKSHERTAPFYSNEQQHEGRDDSPRNSRSEVNENN